MQRETAITQLSEALATIALDEIEARQEEIRARSEKLAATIENTQRELTGIVNEISQRERAGPDPNAAAETLLAGRDVLELDDLPRLEARRNALRVGLEGLRRRQNSSFGAPDVVRREVRAQLTAGARPAAELLEETVRAAVQQLADAYADIAALAAATTSPELAALTRWISPALAELGRSPLIDAVALEPASDLANALDIGAEALKAAHTAFPESIPFPRPEPEIGAVQYGRAAAERHANP